MLTASDSTPAAAVQSLFGFWPAFVVLAGDGIDYLSSGANDGQYDTHHPVSQDDLCQEAALLQLYLPNGPVSSGQTSDLLNHTWCE